MVHRTFASPMAIAPKLHNGYFFLSGRQVFEDSRSQGRPAERTVHAHDDTRTALGDSAVYTRCIRHKPHVPGFNARTARPSSDSRGGGSTAVQAQLQ